MEELIAVVKKEYPLMQLVDDEANGENSIQFTRYGLLDFDVWFAIRSKSKLELYDNKGDMKLELDI